MFDAIQLMINGVWGILSVTIPVSTVTYTYIDKLTGLEKTIQPLSFTLWQYAVFIFIAAKIIKAITGNSLGGIQPRKE